MLEVYMYEPVSRRGGQEEEEEEGRGRGGAGGTRE